MLLSEQEKKTLKNRSGFFEGEGSDFDVEIKNDGDQVFIKHKKILECQCISTAIKMG